jgi:hypothetical protein
VSIQRAFLTVWEVLLWWEHLFEVTSRANNDAIATGLDTENLGFS